ncbi:hypothetical protein SAMN02745157_4855 [Kaistia soli DSM 19436]|uniref:Putative DnaT-like domain-containing protein n=1 Tax=Kaistia soli DSM 19436 TaxID=1122133 RepID=A0A1M5MQQ9_9HYPH|nr:DnaT-like ssDNA-binding protein [Kaistia soli]SHG79618.1 hypothetical protein SAMN02745157_4855 [Kaistia soli DSM 19436]
MTLIVEDGTGRADAESYVSVADAVAYASARGLTFQAAPAEAAEAALRRATAWIDATYAPRFSGARLKRRAQALAWPRAGAEDADCNAIASNEIPAEMITATSEAAVRELAKPGNLSPDLKRGGAIKRVKAVSVEVEYAAGATAGTVFSTIDGILSGLLGAQSAYTARAVRG